METKNQFTEQFIEKIQAKSEKLKAQGVVCVEFPLMFHKEVVDGELRTGYICVDLPAELVHCGALGGNFGKLLIDFFDEP